MVYNIFKQCPSFKVLFLMALFSFVPFASAEEIDTTPKVVVTIKPLHSLVSGVMQGIDEPTLLLKGSSSPHHFQLKPSDALAIKKADLIVRVGPQLETPLNKTLKSLSNKNSVLSVMGIKGIKHYKMRSKHHHHGDDHDNHKKHSKHEHHDDHDDHKKHAKHKHHDDHGDHEEGHNSQKDPHIWLDTGNAKVIVFSLAEELSKIDPKNSKTYRQNAISMSGQIDKLSLEISALLKPLDDRSYMVFHDAYQYLTRPYDLRFSGAITFNPATPPSAKHLRTLIKQLKKEKVVCIFSEVQYNPKLINTLSEDRNIKTAVLDPIGAKLNAGSKAYFVMMKSLSAEINKCMKP